MKKFQLIMKWVYKLWQDFLELLYPSNIYCLCCGKPIDKTMPYSLCATCVRMLKWAVDNTCSKCGRPLDKKAKHDRCRDCMQNEKLFSKGFTCVGYGRMEREMIHCFKYYNRPYYSSKMADLMYERMLLEDLKIDFIIPVPMYKAKERRRGYNQANLLARSLAARMNIQYRDDILKRRFDTIPMSSLGAEERKDNVLGAFCILAHTKGCLVGKNILLVDDIYTTGSTADSCTAVLREAGVREVYIITFAAGIAS